MLKPAYKLTLGGQLVDTADEPRASTVVDLEVRLDMDIPADRHRQDKPTIRRVDNIGELGRPDGVGQFVRARRPRIAQIVNIDPVFEAQGKESAATVDIGR